MSRWLIALLVSGPAGAAINTLVLLAAKWSTRNVPDGLRPEGLFEFSPLINGERVFVVNAMVDGTVILYAAIFLIIVFYDAEPFRKVFVMSFFSLLLCSYIYPMIFLFVGFPSSLVAAALYMALDGTPFGLLPFAFAVYAMALNGAIIAAISALLRNQLSPRA